MKTKIYLAGGCFWCIEADITKFDSKLNVLPGYMGGQTQNPTYEEVCMGLTGHYEVVRVVTDNPFEPIIDSFWRMIDPFDPSGQLHDRGLQYRTAIFYTNEAQKEYALKTKKAIQDQFEQVVHTLILPAKTFFPAEVYHQKYHVKNHDRYQTYVTASGRHHLLKEIWKNK